MKDIDFDELDRAVSSVLGSSGPTNASEAAVTPASSIEDKPIKKVSAATAKKPQEIVASQPADDSGSSAEHIEVQVPERPVGASPVIRPRSGRFMDVVHPSSDMKSDSPAPQPVASNPVSKTRLSPVSPDLKADISPSQISPVTQEPELSANAPQTAMNVATQEIGDAEGATVQTEAYSDGSFSQTEASSQDDVLVSAPPAVPTFDESQWSESLDGDVSAADVASPAEPVDVGNLPSADEFSGQAAPSDAADESQNSLDDELVIEEPVQTPFISDAKVEKRPLGAFGVEPTEVSPQAPDSEQELAASVPTMESDTLQPVENEALPQASQSQPLPMSAEDMDSVAPAMFDSQEYHQPVTGAHPGPSRLKRVFIVILVILLLLAVGAGVGYGVYVYQVGF